MSISVKIASHFSGKIQIWLKSGQILAFEKIGPLKIQPKSGYQQACNERGRVRDVLGSKTYAAATIYYCTA